jgi:hypothetical protein
VTLERRRTLGELLADAIALYGRHWRTYLLIAITVVVPVDLIVRGIGLGELSDPYPQDQSQAGVLLGYGVWVLVTTPLVTAMVIAVLRQVDRGERPSARAAIQSGLDLFAPTLLAIVLSAVAIAAGFAALLVPGVFLLVRLHFVVQAVVVDDRRDMEALRRSWEVTRGSFWRVFGVILVFGLAFSLPGALLAVPFDAVARSADAYGIALAGTIIGEIIAVPALAIATTLLYFDLRDRVAVRTAG